MNKANGLLVAATAKEIAPFLDRYREDGHSNRSLPDMDILITGIGLAASVFSILKQIQLKPPRFVIQAGIAGCFDKNISLGTVVAIKQDTIADQGVIEQNQLKTVFDMGLTPLNQFPYSKGWLINKSLLFKKIKIKKVKGISVNQVTTSRQMIKLLQDRFSPSVESMEGAALHYACLMENIPFLQLRAVSNYIGERNKKNWNIKEAIINLNKELTEILEHQPLNY